MAKEELSARQKQILEFINGFDEEHSYPPTIRDIQYACTISSTSVVDYNLKILERKGYIRRDREVSRGIEVLGGDRQRVQANRVPVLGSIAAGEPIPVPAQESWAATEPVDMLDIPQGFPERCRRRLRPQGEGHLYDRRPCRRRGHGDSETRHVHQRRGYGCGLAQDREGGHPQAALP